MPVSVPVADRGPRKGTPGSCLELRRPAPSRGRASSRRHYREPPAGAAGASGSGSGLGRDGVDVERAEVVETPRSRWQPISFLTSRGERPRACRPSRGTMGRRVDGVLPEEGGGVVEVVAEAVVAVLEDAGPRGTAVVGVVAGSARRRRKQLQARAGAAAASGAASAQPLTPVKDGAGLASSSP